MCDELGLERVDDVRSRSGHDAGDSPRMARINGRIVEYVELHSPEYYKKVEAGWRTLSRVDVGLITYVKMEPPLHEGSNYERKS